MKKENSIRQKIKAISKVNYVLKNRDVQNQKAMKQSVVVFDRKIDTKKLLM